MSGRCIPVPNLPVPELGFGLSFSPPTLDLGSFELEICCKILAFKLPPIPIPLPSVDLALSTTILKEAIGKVNDFINALPLSCPLE